LAADAGSRTSVALARIILDHKFDCRPTLSRQAPSLDAMLANNDAALIIGDPALQIVPDALPYHCLDLGAEWTSWTGLPMVFAVWAGYPLSLTPDLAEPFIASYRWGMQHLDEIVRAAEQERGFPAALAHEYLTRHIEFELTPRHLEGLALYRKFVRELPPFAPEV
jgi:predicted solute-binding protein